MDGLQKTAIGMQYKGGDLSWSGRSTEMVDGREGLLQRVKPPLLMSPVFNHHTVEWFYAYFICISLNRVSEGHSEPGEVQSWGEREEKKVPMMLIFKQGLVP
uniref:Uncharacterized protein n=1 Tax=Panthera tigris altaica TaxID=74533 RepID=A0A8C9JIW8_PANTA